MAWTTPRTWVVGEVVTAAIMNAHVRDNENYLKSFAVQSQNGSGSSSSGGAGAANIANVTFSPAYAAAPVVLVNVVLNPLGTYLNVNAWASAVATTGASLYAVVQAANNLLYAWQAIGAPA